MTSKNDAVDLGGVREPAAIRQVAFQCLTLGEPTDRRWRTALLNGRDLTDLLQFWIIVP